MIKNFKIGTTSYAKIRVTATWSEWEKSTFVAENGGFGHRVSETVAIYKKKPTRSDVLNAFDSKKSQNNPDELVDLI